MTALIGRPLPRIGRPLASVPLRSDLKDFSGLMDFVNRDDATKADVLVRWSEVDFTDRKTLIVPVKGKREEFALNDHSFAQLSKHAAIPTRYLLTCPVTGRGGMRDQIETRMSPKANTNFLVRLRRNTELEGVDGVVRAILTESYTPFDNRHLVPVLTKAARTAGFGVEVVNHNLGNPKTMEKALQIRVVKADGFELHGVDAHKVGFTAGTSEVGEGNVDVSALMWRLVCSNGMMGWGDEEILSVPHRRLGVPETGAKILEAIVTAWRQESVAKERLLALLGQVVDNPEGAILNAARALKLAGEVSLRLIDEWRKMLDAEGRPDVPTRYHVMQVFTAFAKGMGLARAAFEERVGAYFIHGRVSKRSVVDTEGEDVTNE